MEASRPASTSTAALASFVAETGIDELPPAVVAHAKLDVLDTLGCALYGAHLPLVRRLRGAYRSETPPAGGAAIWGAGWDTLPETAAFVNGTQVHSFELDDLHAEAILHPGGVTLPAVLALSDEGTSGAELIVSHAVGLEVGCRLGLALGVRMLQNGFHNNGVLGSLAAAAGAASVLDLDLERAHHALGIGGSLAAGLMAAQYGSMVKRIHAGNAAQTGVKAARLAAAGITGIDGLLEEPYGGYVSAFVGPDVDLAEITHEIGKTWHMLDIGFKPYAACGSSHTAIDVALELHAEVPDLAEHIDRIDVSCSSVTFDHVGWAYVPDSVTTAQMNLPYAMAIALLSGGAGVDQFTEERIRDPRVGDLARRILCSPDRRIDARGRSHRHEIDVSVELTDGRQLRRHRVNAHGSASDPMASEDVERKFIALASVTMSEESAHELMDMVLDLDAHDRLGRLIEALRGPARESHEPGR